MHQEHSADFGAVDAYTRQRLARYGDVYAWAPLETGAEPRAVLLVSHTADLTSFPKSIGQVGIVLKVVSTPEPYRGKAPSTAARPTSAAQSRTALRRFA